MVIITLMTTVRASEIPVKGTESEVVQMMGESTTGSNSAVGCRVNGRGEDRCHGDDEVVRMR